MRVIKVDYCVDSSFLLLTALAIAMVSFWRGAHRAKTSNEKRDPFGNALIIFIIL